MAHPTLDIIVRNVLLKDRRSIHWYLEYLAHAKDCLRELTFDILQITNTKKLALNSRKAVPFPCDYHDFVMVGTPVGQYVKPLLQYSKINDLINYDTNGQPALFPDPSQCNIYSFGIDWSLSTINEHGENIGRLYGYGQGREIDTYKIVESRKEFQFNQHFKPAFIILEYLSDGTDCDAATSVNPYAQATIEAYIKWQYKECNRTYGLTERKVAEDQFLKQRTHLVSRMNPLTVEDVKRIARRSYHAAPKS